jgi:hypothetical protein
LDYGCTSDQLEPEDEVSTFDAGHGRVVTHICVDYWEAKLSKIEVNELICFLNRVWQCTESGCQDILPPNTVFWKLIPGVLP